MHTLGSRGVPIKDHDLQEISTVTGRKLLQVTHNNTNLHDWLNEDSDEYPRDLLHSAAAFFMVLAILGIIGNLIAYFALTKNNKLKYFTSTIFINLTSADLLISCLYSFMVSILFIRASGHYGNDDCRVFAFVKYTGSMICMFMITAIAFNRFMSTVYPKKYLAMFTNKNICLLVTGIWFFPLILLAFPAFEVGGRFAYDRNTGSCELLENNSLKNFSIFLIFILCPVVIINCYATICIAVIARRNGWTCFKNSSSPRESEENLNAIQDPANDGKEYRPLVFIFLIFIITIVCYTPLFFVKTVRDREDYYVKHVICYLLYFFASTVKPAIYYVMSKDYRENYKRIFTRSTTFP